MSTIADKLERLGRYKYQIQQAIQSKGVSVGNNMSTFASAISQISGGGIDFNIDETDPLTFICIYNVGDDWIKLDKVGTVADRAFQYNKNNNGWTTYTIGEEIPVVYGDRIQFKNLQNVLSSGSAVYYNFKNSGGTLFKCGGRMNSMINDITAAPAYAFLGLFLNMSIISSPSLLGLKSFSTQTLYRTFYRSMVYDTIEFTDDMVFGSQSCAEMYGQCRNLYNAKEIKGHINSSFVFSTMFRECINLVNAPNISAVVDKAVTQVFANMFYGCEKLTTPPKELRFENVGTSFYGNMFYNCTSLKESPKIYASNMTNANACSSMFQNCNSIEHIWCNIGTTNGNAITSVLSQNFTNNSAPNCTYHYGPALDITKVVRGTDTINANYAIEPWEFTEEEQASLISLASSPMMLSVEDIENV